MNSLRARLLRDILILGLALGIVAVLAMTMGSASVSWSSFVKGDLTARTIILSIRLPRVLAAALIGAILASAGATFQTVLRNGLAEPFVLGVSGGAACAAAIATAIGIAAIPGVLALVAFAGALVATALVFAFSRSGGVFESARLLISGLVLNAFFSAVILIALSFSSSGNLSAAIRWMMGSIGNSGRGEVVMLSLAALVSIGVLIFYGGELRLMIFGEEDARSRGVNTERTKVVAFMAASLATGAAVAAGGIIGFVGLLVPHLVRRFRGSDFRIVLPLSGLAGATLLVAADALARSVVAPAELPVGALTALLGVPFFLLILKRAW
jgi:iron complex transport system permease protein